MAQNIYYINKRASHAASSIYKTIMYNNLKKMAMNTKRHPYFQPFKTTLFMKINHTLLSF